MPIRLEIVGGGSKAELFAQLVDIGRMLDRNRPIFRFELRYSPGKTGELLVQVDGIKAEDGSGAAWMITGRVYEVPKGVVGKAKANIAPNTPFSGYYNTRRRNGWLEIS